jgi:hypothetical protein
MQGLINNITENEFIFGFTLSVWLSLVLITFSFHIYLGNSFEKKFRKVCNEQRGSFSLDDETIKYSKFSYFELGKLVMNI